MCMLRTRPAGRATLGRAIRRRTLTALHGSAWESPGRSCKTPDTLPALGPVDPRAFAVSTPSSRIVLGRTEEAFREIHVAIASAPDDPGATSFPRAHCRARNTVGPVRTAGRRSRRARSVVRAAGAHDKRGFLWTAMSNAMRQIRVETGCVVQSESANRRFDSSPLRRGLRLWPTSNQDRATRTSPHAFFIRDIRTRAGKPGPCRSRGWAVGPCQTRTRARYPISDQSQATIRKPARRLFLSPTFSRSLQGDSPWVPPRGSRTRFPPASPAWNLVGESGRGVVPRESSHLGSRSWRCARCWPSRHCWA
jgi:hypothetical protein